MVKLMIIPYKKSDALKKIHDIVAADLVVLTWQTYLWANVFVGFLANLGFSRVKHEFNTKRDFDEQYF